MFYCKGGSMEKSTIPGAAGGLFPKNLRLPAPLRRLRRSVGKELIEPLEKLADISVIAYYERLMKEHRNPLNRCGKRVFSQNEEDGITYEILRRIGIERGVFAEFGVGDGLENNTIFLASLGWKGFWVGGERLAFAVPPTPGAKKTRGFAYFMEFITKDNILFFAKRGLEAISETTVDVVSLDLDGNDIYFVEELLNGGFLPRVFIVEYNSKFMPPIRWRIKYNPAHIWMGDDYFGASLMEYKDLFERHDYFLACCNAASGSNAFFVHASYREAFQDVPQDINHQWSPPIYISPTNGHRASNQTVAQIIADISLVRSRVTDSFVASDGDAEELTVSPFEEDGIIRRR
jgi:hypothetical protein